MMQTITDILCESFIANGDRQTLSQLRAFLAEKNFTDFWSDTRFYQIKRGIELIRAAIRSGKTDPAAVKKYVNNKSPRAFYRDSLFQLVLADEQAKTKLADFSATDDAETINKVVEVVGNDVNTVTYVLANLGFSGISTDTIKTITDRVPAVPPVAAVPPEHIFNKYVEFIDLNKKHGQEAVKEIGEFLQEISGEDFDRIQQIWKRSVEVFAK